MYQQHCYTLQNKAVDPPEVLDVNLTRDEVWCVIAQTYYDMLPFISQVIYERTGDDVSPRFNVNESRYEENSYEGYRESSRSDYSPSCPWNAPGMRVSDFI